MGIPKARGHVLRLQLIFSIYTNDLPLFIKACRDLFADETTLHTSHSDLKQVSESLQESVNSLPKLVGTESPVSPPQQDEIYASNHPTKEAKYDLEMPTSIRQRPNR